MHKEPRRRETEEDGRVEEMGRRGSESSMRTRQNNFRVSDTQRKSDDRHYGRHGGEMETRTQSREKPRGNESRWQKRSSSGGGS